MDGNPYHLRFGLKTLFVAVLTCGAAFMVISWQPPWLVTYIALCVPALWLLMLAGSLVPGRSTAMELVRVLVWSGLALLTVAVSLLLEMR